MEIEQVVVNDVITLMSVNAGQAVNVSKAPLLDHTDCREVRPCMTCSLWHISQLVHVRVRCARILESGVSIFCVGYHEMPRECADRSNKFDLCSSYAHKQCRHTTGAQCFPRAHASF